MRSRTSVTRQAADRPQTTAERAGVELQQPLERAVAGPPAKAQLAAHPAGEPARVDAPATRLRADDRARLARGRLAPGLEAPVADDLALGRTRMLHGHDVRGLRPLGGRRRGRAGEGGPRGGQSGHRKGDQDQVLHLRLRHLQGVFEPSLDKARRSRMRLRARESRARRAVLPCACAALDDGLPHGGAGRWAAALLRAAAVPGLRDQPPQQREVSSCVLDVTVGAVLQGARGRLANGSNEGARA